VLTSILLLAAAPSSLPNDVGGFSYRIVISDHTKKVKLAPRGYPPTWKQHVETVVGTDPKDGDFSRLMWRAVRRSERGFKDEGDKCTSFNTCEAAGSLDITEELVSASPDLISVRIGTSFYEAGMPHPNSAGARSYIWSRRLHRLLAESDVFALRPDRTLRRLAQSAFDNRRAMTNPDNPDGIPLRWDRASIGPQGITWFFEPYELGGYPSGGTATIEWSALKPYLRRKLPFEIRSIRSAPNRFER
jgi:hypothetical protein